MATLQAVAISRTHQLVATISDALISRFNLGFRFITGEWHHKYVINLSPKLENKRVTLMPK
jgi:hypothetical protein